MIAPQFIPNLPDMIAAYNKSVASSTSDAHVKRTDRLTRTTAERWAQRGGLLEVVEMLRSSTPSWRPNRCVHIPKDDGSMRMIESPSIRVQVASEALRQHIERFVTLPTEFYGIGNSESKTGLHAGLHAAHIAVALAELFARFDIYRFFDSIDHDHLRATLLKILHEADVERIMTLVRLPSIQADSKIVQPRTVGISQGNPLSPLLAHLYIAELTSKLSDLVDHQVWYIDDFILVPKADVSAEELVERVIELLAELKLQPKTSKLDELIIREECIFLGDVLKTSPKQLAARRMTFLHELIEKSPTSGLAGLSENHTCSVHTGRIDHMDSIVVYGDSLFCFTSPENPNPCSAYCSVVEHICLNDGRDPLTSNDVSHGVNPNRGISAWDLEMRTQHRLDDALPLQAVYWCSPELGRSPSPQLTLGLDSNRLLLQVGQALFEPDGFDHHISVELTATRSLAIPKNTFDMVVIAFSANAASPSKIRHFLTSVVNHCAKRIRAGGEIHVFTTDTLTAMMLSTLNVSEASRVLPWHMDTPNNTAYSLAVFRKNGIRRPPQTIELHRLDDVYIARIEGQTVFSSLDSCWMRGQIPRPRAAMYDTLAKALRFLSAQGVREVLVRHHGDVQAKLINEWTPRKSYLQRPIQQIRRLQTAFSHIHYERFNSKKG